MENIQLVEVEQHTLPEVTETTTECILQNRHYETASSLNCMSLKLRFRFSIHACTLIIIIGLLLACILSYKNIIVYLYGLAPGCGTYARLVFVHLRYLFYSRHWCK